MSDHSRHLEYDEMAEATPTLKSLIGRSFNTRVDLPAERNLADVERALTIAAPFVFGGGEGEGDEGDRGEEDGKKEGEDDGAHAYATMTCWAWAASCVAKWRARRFIAERTKPACSTWRSWTPRRAQGPPRGSS